MAAGVAVALIAKGVITPSRGADMPGWLGWAVAVIFFVPGAFVFVNGVRNVFVFLGKDSGEAPLFAKGMILFFDLIPVLVLLGIVTTLWHKAKYGRSRLAFGSFPFHLGGTLSARFSTRRAVGQFKTMTFTLRCIEERKESRRAQGGRTSIRTVCDQIWADVFVLDQPGALYDGEFPISFKLPAGDYGTRFMEAPARYWELEVKADTPGLDFGPVFLVPVYARPC